MSNLIAALQLSASQLCPSVHLKFVDGHNLSLEESYVLPVMYSFLSRLYTRNIWIDPD